MITLKTHDGYEECHEGIPEGIEVIPRTYEYEGEEHIYEMYRYPELGAPRLYKSRGPVIVPINGQNYLVSIVIDDDRDGIPSSATVTFMSTDEPETPYEVWDSAAHHKKMRAKLLEEIAEYEAEDKEDGDSYFWKSHIKNLKSHVEDIDNGEECYGHGRYLQFFGQPVFIQNSIFPSYNGKSACHLATLDTGWGDSGNVNIMVALDDGVPVKVWFEASCC